MKARILLIACMFGITGCATRYVERSSDYTERNPEMVKTADTIMEAINDVVVFESSRELKSTPLSCLAVFPLKAKKEDLRSAESIRSALHAHLAPTGIRLVALQQVDAAIKATHGSGEDSTAAIAGSIGCDTIMQGEVTDGAARFYGVYSEVRAGAKVRIIKASTGTVLWQGSHTAVLRGGGVPFGMVSLAMNVVFAGLNLMGEQGVRVIHDLARRLVLAIPDLAYQAEMLPGAELPVLAKVEPDRPQTAYGLIASLESLSADQIAQRLIEELKSDRWNRPQDRVLLSEALIRIDDRQPLGHYQAALARLQLSEPGAALPSAQRAVALEPANADSQFLLGRIHLVANQPKEATEPLIKAVALGDAKVIHLSALGTAYNQMGDYPRAAASFAKVLAKDGVNNYALLHGAIAQAGTGANGEAVKMLRRGMILGIARGDPSAATRALNILRAMDLAKLMPEGELHVLESKIKALKVS